MKKGLIIKKIFIYISFIFLLSGCLSTKPTLSSSATILIKTPSMKFYDKGFIFNYTDYTQVQIFSAGTSILDMKIYKDRICSSTFKCQSLQSFNAQNLHKSYEKDFIKKLFERKEKKIIHRDKKNKILIKILKD